MAHNGFHLHQGGKAIASRPPQVQQTTAPLKPTREAILDLFLDHWTVPEIAMKTRTSASTVMAVTVAYMEQFHRQSIAGKLDAAPCVIERYREIEAECWQDFSTRKKAA